GTGVSENVRSQDGGPKLAASGGKPRGRCACSQASTACGRPGARQKETSSTSAVETRVEDGNLRASGAFGNRCPPGGTTRARRRPPASATARSRAVGGAVAPDAAVTVPVVVCVAAQPATAVTAQAA